MRNSATPPPDTERVATAFPQHAALRAGVASAALLFISGIACTGGPVDAGTSMARDAGVVSMDAGNLDSGADDAGTLEHAPRAFLSPAMASDLVATNGVQFVDVRSAADYAAGHVPGAIHLDTSGLRTSVGGVAGQVVSRDAAVSIFEAAGLDADAHLVFVGAANDTNTSRALWTAAFFGASSTLSLLDGGHAAWLNMGLGLSTESAAGVESWQGENTAEALRVDKDWVLAHLNDAEVAFFDVRTSGEYEAGHIPGARNTNWTGTLAPDGMFKSEQMLHAYFGQPSETTLVVYCQSGARASVGWAVLTGLGYDDVRLYDGSWNEWGVDASTPKETGPE